jgi:DNA-binding NtrC family response regulator
LSGNGWIREVDSTKAGLTSPAVFPVFNSPGLALVAALARRVADIPGMAVLIVADRGAPTEALARVIHGGRSGDAGGTLVHVRCGDRSPTAIEVDLFGGFGEPNPDAPAAVIRARGGTLFIDSIASLGAGAQARLAALLSEEAVLVPNHLDLRVIAATAVDLSAMVRQRRFRTDLFERISTITITIPPLRKRPEDIEVLATMFACEAARAVGRPFRGFSREALAKLRHHSYPGNEEELYRTVKRAIAGDRGARIGAFAIAFDSPPATVADMFVADTAIASDQGNGRLPTLAEVERAYVIWALKHTDFNRTAAARLLGISYPTIAKKIADYRIDLESLERAARNVRLVNQRAARP